MSPIQQMLLGVGASTKATYIDDVFSTYLWKGNSSTRSINNSIDISTEGGLVWIKSRDSANGHQLFDTERGAGKYLKSHNNSAEGTDTTRLSAFNNNGFSLGSESSVNHSSFTYAGWTFRKSPAFTICTWNGNETAGRQISHELNSVPGCIIVKCTSDPEFWLVYHRGVNGGVNPEKYGLKLNETDAKSESAEYWNNSAPTSTYFTVGNHVAVNGDTEHTYVAYVFAGGSTADQSSVVLDGTGDYLSCGSSSDFSFGTGDFTIEGWFKKDDSTQGGFWQISTTSGGLGGVTAPACAWTGSAWQMYGGGDNTNSAPTLVANKWYHIAQVRHSGTTTMYVDGVPVITKSDTADYAGTHLAIGGYYSTSFLHEGKISNFRVVKGTAVYKSSFRPQHKELENISGTVLLCCNGSTTTSSTVTPTTITANGDPTMDTTDSPQLMDPSGFVFGDAGDQNVIKCGSYVGNGDSNNPPEVYLGFEPSWLLIKNASTGSTVWQIFDVMRGLNNDGSGASARLEANSSSAEATNAQAVTINSTGFIATGNGSYQNSSGDTFVYMALRRPDGYVGKPPELGTGVFAMDTGASSSTIPNYDSGFPVDFTLQNSPVAGNNWRLMTRLTGSKQLRTNDTTAESTYAAAGKFDSNVGYSEDADGSGSQSWMWKRSAGVDVVAYKGDDRSGGRPISHNLSVTPEMMWIKARNNASQPWMVYHKDVGHGKVLNLNSTSAESNNIYYLNNEAPNSTHFTVGQADYVNGDYDYIAMLFASVDGISKVGSYTAPTTPNEYLNIDCGFVPRFIIIKGANIAQDWTVFDTLRGLTASAGNDPFLALNSNAAQISSQDCVELTSTGFRIREGWNIRTSQSGYRYIFYAHA